MFDQPIKKAETKSSTDTKKSNFPESTLSGKPYQIDHRPEAVFQKKIIEIAQFRKVENLQNISSSPSEVQDPIQKKKNDTGLPDGLKSGIENLSGYGLDDVNVHRNSTKPAQLNAHAFAQGTDIHLAPGQEQHLPHEAWHVVQQKQGRVKPTMQTKNGHSVNDDLGLESEATLMGGKALQTKSKGDTKIKTGVSSQVSQLVKDESLRPYLDQRTIELKQKTREILQVMGTLGQDWEKNYGKQGKDKASEKVKGLLEGETTDYSAEIKKAALRELWSRLTPEEKLQMASEAAKMSGSALSSLLSNGWTAIQELVQSSNSEPSAKKEKQPREKSSQEEPKRKEKQVESSKSESGSNFPKLGSAGFLNDLEPEDIYRLYKARKKVLDEIAKAKSKVTDTAGELGGFVGEEVGKFMDERDFEKRMLGQKNAFLVAGKRLELLKEAIADNEDSSRYENEIVALEYALKSLNGPGIVFRFELNDSARKEHPNKCMLTIDAISNSGPIITRDNSFFDVIGSVKRVGESLIESSNSKKLKLSSAQQDLSTELKGALDKSWSKYTSWGWTPDGVSKIRKGIDSHGAPKEKLEWAKGIAKDAAAKESSNRSPETQIFYELLAKVDVTDEVKLKTITGELHQISSLLG
ncbi:eCIS core domain-containing protein [Algoriphagus aquimarinus]|uniref:eCIS core domain-containing protein n=1 Tax=Algoriphagus aquimarinus TaxID=237018 RepID=A0A1I1BSE4_9BACT|nr:DUF4157 domain-containing protein [Algoriphagus aquimarinus]SFB53364.1 protein of unknown function [Algoriphagus aquimarinus]